jgi:hypothetical protein
MNWGQLPLAKVAALALAIGWLPLLLYLPYDWLRGGGGNPVGFGLLLVASTALAAALLGAQILLSLVQRFRRR